MPPYFSHSKTSLRKIILVIVQDAILLLSVFLTMIIIFSNKKTEALIERLSIIHNEALELYLIIEKVSGNIRGNNDYEFNKFVKTPEWILNNLETFIVEDEKEKYKELSTLLKEIVDQSVKFTKFYSSEDLLKKLKLLQKDFSQTSKNLLELSDKIKDKSVCFSNNLDNIAHNLPNTSKEFQLTKKVALLLSNRIKYFPAYLKGVSNNILEEAQHLSKEIDHLTYSIDPMNKINFIKGFLIVIIIKLCFHYNGLYEVRLKTKLSQFIIILFQSVGQASLILGIIYILFKNLMITTPLYTQVNYLFLWIIIMVICLTILWRIIFDSISSSRGFKMNFLIVGTGAEAQRIVKILEETKSTIYNIIGYIDENSDKIGEFINNVPIIGSYEDIEDIISKYEVDQIIVAMPERRGKFPSLPLLKAKLSGIKIVDDTYFYEEFIDKIPVENLKPSWIIFSEGFRKSKFLLWSKRIFDIIFSIIGLILAFPIMVITAILIKLESPGKILYKQERVGENNKRFNILKFRSMREDAEKTSGPVWATKNDSRVTRVGRFIRATRIDELPQMINVLKGEMSFVGPRPERPFFVEQLMKEIPYYGQRLSVKPGITGWAQTRYTYAATLEDNKEKLMYDLYYIKHMSLWLDLVIIFDTIKVVLRKIGGW